MDEALADGAPRCDGAVLLTAGIGKPPQPDLQWDNRQDLWLAVYGADGLPLCY